MSDPAAAPPTGPIPIPPDIGAIAASQLIGSLLNWGLYGVLAVQVYIWRLTFPDDKPGIKWMVYLIFLIETVATGLNGWDVYYWFAAGFGNVLTFTQPRTSSFYTPMLGAVMALVVQTFFCYRIYIIKRQAWPLCVFIFLISMLQAAGGLGGGISSYLASNTTHDHNRVIFVYLWLVGESVADVLIAVTMSYLLLKAGQHQHRQTNDIVRRIVRLTVETNTVSTIVAVLSVILFYGTPNTTYFIAPTMVLAKLYANTLLVTFNNRAFVHGKGANGTSVISGSRSGTETYTGSRISGKQAGGTGHSRNRSLPFSAGLGLGGPEDDVELDGMTFADPAHRPGAGGRVTVTTRAFGSATMGSVAGGAEDYDYGRELYDRRAPAQPYTLDRLDARHSADRKPNDDEYMPAQAM